MGLTSGGLQAGGVRNLSEIVDIPDSFEIQNLGEYIGDTADFGFTTARAFDGSVSLVCNVASTHNAIEWGNSVTGTSGTREASMYLYKDGTNDNNAGVALVNSSQNGYMSYLNDSNDKFAIVTYESGYLLEIGSVAESIGDSAWYQLVIIHDGADGVSAELRDSVGTVLESLSVTDNSYSNMDRPAINSYAADVPIDLLDAV
jgi:hypothetical protein